MRSARSGAPRSTNPIVGNEWRRSALGDDGLGLDLELDLLAVDHTTGLEGGVPGEAEVLAVDLAGGAESDAEVVVGVDELHLRSRRRG